MIAFYRNISTSSSLRQGISFDVSAADLTLPRLSKDCSGRRHQQSPEDWLGPPAALSSPKPSMKLVEVASIPIAGAASHCFFRLWDFTSRTEEYNKTLKKPFTEAPDGALLAVSQAGKR